MGLLTSVFQEFNEMFWGGVPGDEVLIAVLLNRFVFEVRLNILVDLNVFLGKVLLDVLLKIGGERLDIVVDLECLGIECKPIHLLCFLFYLCCSHLYRRVIVCKN